MPPAARAAGGESRQFDFDVHMERRSRTRELALADLAARQRGIVSRRQLLLLGFGSGAIDARIRKGRLNVVFRGVYAAGHPVLPRWARPHAAAVLSRCLGASAMLG